MIRRTKSLREKSDIPVGEQTVYQRAQSQTV